MNDYPHLLETDAERDTWMLEVNEPTFLVFADGTAWIAYSTEDGDWFATRPANDDDRREDGTFPDGVTWSFEGLPLPVLVAQSAEMPDLDTYREVQ